MFQYLFYGSLTQSMATLADSHKGVSQTTEGSDGADIAVQSLRVICAGAGGFILVFRSTELECEYIPGSQQSKVMVWPARTKRLTLVWKIDTETDVRSATCWFGCAHIQIWTSSADSGIGAARPRNNISCL